MKICTSCKCELPLDKFRVRSGNKTRSECRECENAKERGRHRYKYDRDKDRSYKLRRLYGVDTDDVQRFLIEQNGKCPICNGILDPDGIRASRPYVDHCHETGKVRGLLCHHCNTGLGYFKDSRERLEAAVAYLASAV